MNFFFSFLALTEFLTQILTFYLILDNSFLSWLDNLEGIVCVLEPTQPTQILKKVKVPFKIKEDFKTRLLQLLLPLRERKILFLLLPHFIQIGLSRRPGEEYPYTYCLGAYPDSLGLSSVCRTVHSAQEAETLKALHLGYFLALNYLGSIKYLLDSN